MTSKTRDEQCKILRQICTRIDAARGDELPHVASYLTSSLPLCRDLLLCSDEQLRSFSSNALSLVNRYRTALSSLIQDKAEGRKLAAIKLIKATIQIGGYEVLAKSGHWVRGLIACIKSSWVDLRCVAIVTLVSIFRSTHGLPNLTREITSLTLPDFISTCINSFAPKRRDSDTRAISNDDRYISTVLSAFVTLVPNHPATFRPFVNQLSLILGALVSPTVPETGEGFTFRSGTLRACAQSLHALLPRSANKGDGGPGEKWLNQVGLIERQIRHTIKEVYRSLELHRMGVTDGANGSQQFVSSDSKAEEPPSSEVLDELQLKKWTGLNAGAHRIIDLLNTLEAYIATKGSVTYTLPVRQILGVIENVLSAFPGQHLDSLSTTSRKADISRDEFESLFMSSQAIQIAALDCLARLLGRLGPHNKGILNGALEDLLWRLKGRTDGPALRSSFYKALGLCIEGIGPTLSKETTLNIEEVLMTAVADLLGDFDLDGGVKGSQLPGGLQRQDADAYFQKTKIQARSLQRNEASTAAAAFIEIAVRCIPATSFSNQARVTLDRTAILVRDEPIMLASILNTSTQQTWSRPVASIVPYLARENPGSLVVDGLLRPRLPVIKLGGSNQQKIQMDTYASPFETDMMQFDGSDPPIVMPEPERMEIALDQAIKDSKLDSRPDPGLEPRSNIAAIPTEEMHSDKPSQPLSHHSKPPAEHSQASSYPPDLETVEAPQSPKRAHPDEMDTELEVKSADVKRIKLATFEAAPGPTSVSVITQTPSVPTALAGDLVGDDNDSDGSDDSEIPPIVMGNDDDEEEDEDEDEDD